MSTQDGDELAVANEKAKKEMEDQKKQNSTDVKILMNNQKLLEKKLFQEWTSRHGKSPTQVELDKMHDPNLYSQSAGDEPSQLALLTEKDWSVIVQNNSLLTGWVTDILHRNAAQIQFKKGFQRAERPAFEMVPWLVQGEAKERLIPHWQQQDRSYVAMVETKSAMQESIVKEGLTEWYASASVEAGGLGVAVSASASTSGSNSYAHSTSKQTKESKLVYSYHFPRVLISFGWNSLELTEACRRDLSAITEKSNVRDVYKFLNTYGQYFSTKLELGGRLYTEQRIQYESEADSYEQKESFEAQAMAAFSTASAGGSGGGGGGNKNSTDTQNASAKGNTNVTWEATGGNTLLARDPSQWCPTVGQSKYWRTVRHMPESMRPLLGLIEEWAEEKKKKGPGSKEMELLVSKVKQMRDILEHADEEEERNIVKRYLEAQSQDHLFEILLVGLVKGGSWQHQLVEPAKRWTMLYPENAAAELKKSLYAEACDVARTAVENEHKWMAKDLPTISHEYESYLKNGTAVQFADKLPAGWKPINTNTKFYAKKEDGQRVVDRLILNQGYEIFDETGQYVLTRTTTTPNAMKYAYLVFRKATQNSRKTIIRFQKPGLKNPHEQFDIIKPTTELEIKIDVPDWRDVAYVHSNSTTYNGACMANEHVMEHSGHTPISICKVKIKRCSG